MWGEEDYMWLQRLHVPWRHLLQHSEQNWIIFLTTKWMALSPIGFGGFPRKEIPPSRMCSDKKMTATSCNQSIRRKPPVSRSRRLYTKLHHIIRRCLGDFSVWPGWPAKKVDIHFRSVFVAPELGVKPGNITAKGKCPFLPSICWGSEHFFSNECHAVWGHKVLSCRRCGLVYVGFSHSPKYAGRHLRDAIEQSILADTIATYDEIDLSSTFTKNTVHSR